MLNYREIANQSDCLRHQDHWMSIYQGRKNIQRWFADILQMIVSSFTLFAQSLSNYVSGKKKVKKKMLVWSHPHLLGLDTVELEDRRLASKQWLSRACEHYILCALWFLKDLWFIVLVNSYFLLAIIALVRGRNIRIKNTLNIPAYRSASAKRTFYISLYQLLELRALSHTLTG